MSIAPEDLPETIREIESRIFTATATTRPRIAWTHAQHTYIEVNGLHSLRSYFYNPAIEDWMQKPGEGYAWAKPADGVAEHFHQLREAMLDPTHGAWIVADLLDTPNADGSRNRRIAFDYQRRASWISSDAWVFPADAAYQQPADGDYAADLDAHPRDPAHVPDWMQQATIAPAYTDPIQNTPDPGADARRLMRQVVIDVRDAAVGTGWASARIDWSVDLSSAGGSCTLETSTGEPIDNRGLGRAVMETLRQLFDAVATAEPDRGYPISVHLRIGRLTGWTIEVNHDRRYNRHASDGDDPFASHPDPATASPPDEALVALLERYPRTTEHTPDWYRDIATAVRQRDADRSTRPIESTAVAPAIAARPLVSPQYELLLRDPWWAPVLSAINMAVVDVIRAHPNEPADYDGIEDRRVGALISTAYASLTDALFDLPFPSGSSSDAVIALYSAQRPTATIDQGDLAADLPPGIEIASWGDATADESPLFAIAEHLDSIFAQLIADNLAARLDARLIAALGERHLDHRRPTIASHPALPEQYMPLRDNPWWRPVMRLADSACIHQLATGPYFEMQEGRDTFDIQFEDVVQDAYDQAASRLADRDDYPVPGRRRNRLIVELWRSLAEVSAIVDAAGAVEANSIDPDDLLPDDLHQLQGPLRRMWQDVGGVLGSLVAANLIGRVQAGRPIQPIWLTSEK